MFKFEATDFNNYLNDLNDKLDKIPVLLSKELYDSAIADVPVKTGRLKAGLDYKSSVYSSTVYDNVSYADSVQQRNPYIIEDENIISKLVENLIKKAF